jgi:tRNA-2-methylthio-N6-dimethylallyladenosine synthase
VPYVRGREKSRDRKNILEEIKILAREGYKEILLLGQNVNSYRSDIDFPELLDRVNQIPRIERIRFISSHPKDISEKLIDAMARNEKVCSLLHLPFQSGSDKVLKDMNRNYTRARYMEIIQMAREKIPNISISSDCIVGFPTEDMEAFEDTLDLVSKIKFDSLFTFIYSRRKGTRAYDLPSRLDEAAIKNNFQRLVDLQKNIGLEKNKSMIGKIEKVLAEGVSKNNPDKYTGRTNGGKIVNFKSRENPIGKIVDVKIINAKSFNLEGEV